MSENGQQQECQRRPSEYDPEAYRKVKPAHHRAEAGRRRCGPQKRVIMAHPKGPNLELTQTTVGHEGDPLARRMEIEVDSHHILCPPGQSD